MSTLADLAQWGRSAKERAVRSYPDSGDIPNLVDLERDGQRILRFTTPGVAEILLAAMYTSIPVVAADAIGLVVDSWMHVSNSPDMINPYTGRPFALGDMERAVKMDSALEAGVIQEGIIALRGYRHKPSEQMTMYYVHDRQSGQLAWGRVDDRWDSDEMGHMGRFTAVMAEAFEQDVLKIDDPHERRACDREFCSWITQVVDCRVLECYAM